MYNATLFLQYDYKKMVKPDFSVVIIFIGISFLFVLLMLIGVDLHKYRNDEYKAITNTDNISGYFEKIEVDRGVTFVNLIHLKKFSLNHPTRNYNYSEPFLDDFLKIGDSIFKPANCDTLYIIRDKQRFFFVINSIIGK